eukprot:5737037-Pyramimonas_sp.AAC.2
MLPEFLKRTSQSLRDSSSKQLNLLTIVLMIILLLLLFLLSPHLFQPLLLDELLLPPPAPPLQLRPAHHATHPGPRKSRNPCGGEFGADSSSFRQQRLGAGLDLGRPGAGKRQLSRARAGRAASGKGSAVIAAEPSSPC